MKKNNHLLVAKQAKDDEYYTQLVDIQKELDQYDFSELVVGCPADTAQSEFVNYFTNYNRAKKVIYWQDLLNEEMYNQVDVIITNPPFSLYTDYLVLLAKLNKPFYLVSPIIIHRKSFGLLPYVRSGSNRINHFSNTDKTVPCMWITNFPENRPVFIPEIEHTIYEHNKNGLNVVNKCKDIGKDFKSIPNLCLPTTAFMKNYGWYEPSTDYVIKRGDHTWLYNYAPNYLVKKGNSEVYAYRANNQMQMNNKQIPYVDTYAPNYLVKKGNSEVYAYRANNMIYDPERGGEYCSNGMINLISYKLEPCDKSYFARIIINFQPDKLVMYKGGKNNEK